MDIQQELQKALKQALTALEIDFEGEIHLESTTNASFGDYTSNIAMQLFPSVDKEKWNSPRTLAQAIVDEFQNVPALNSQLSSLSVAGPGFINFTLQDSYFTNILSSFHSKKLPFPNIGKGRTAIVEYSSPNIAKPFTIGHLRSTIIGDAVAHILSAVGYEVKRDNHLGDWGTQFGKLIVAIKKWGDLEAIEDSQTPVKDLVALYIKFHEAAESAPSLEEEGRLWFTKLEKGDEEARMLWQKCIDWSWREFERIYQELGVTFTENAGHGYGESYFENKMRPVIEELEVKHLLQEGNEGAKIVNFPNEELPPLMIVKKDGSTLYATRDLATDKFRLEKYGKDILVVNEVGAEQELYFRQLYRLEQLLGWYTPEQRVHVKHGLFRFKEGKMSTRKGNVIWLADVIDEAKKRALALSKDNSEDIARIVAIGALKWNDLKRSSHLDVTFDWDEILSMDGNSGPYLQYAAVRCASILQKGAVLGESHHIDEAYKYSESERKVVRELLYFQEVLRRAATDFAPHYLCTYLYGLASAYNSFYNTHRVLDDEEFRDQRLAITRAVHSVLTEGLAVLGIAVPAYM